jgi:hypothetical protein
MRSGRETEEYHAYRWMPLFALPCRVRFNYVILERLMLELALTAKKE